MANQDTYTQYIFKDGEYRLVAGSGSGGGGPSAVLEDTITIKEMTIKPSVKARQMAGIDDDYKLAAPFDDQYGSKWVPDPILYIKTNYISDNIYNKISSSDKVVLRINKLTAGNNNRHRKSWRGARFTCRDNFYDCINKQPTYIGDEVRDLWIKYHIIPITTDMISEDNYGKFIEIEINLLNRSLEQFSDLNSNETTIIKGYYSYEKNPQLSAAKISALLNMQQFGDEAIYNSQIKNSSIIATGIKEKMPDDLTDTSWEFNDSLVLDDYITGWTDFSFSTSGSNNWNSVNIQADHIYYSSVNSWEDPDSNAVLVYDSGSWVDPQYQEVYVNSAGDGTLIKFFVENATRTDEYEKEYELVQCGQIASPSWKSFSNLKNIMPTWRYNILGTNNFIPTTSNYKYILDFRTRFAYKDTTPISDYRNEAISIWESDGFKSFMTYGSTPSSSDIIASPVLTTCSFDTDAGCEAIGKVSQKHIKELIQPSFAILNDDWLDSNCKHIWKEKFKKPDKYISIMPREIAYILNEEDYPVEYWMGITYKLGKFN